MRRCWGYATRRQPNVPKCTELGTIVINDPTRPHSATATGSGSRMALPWLLDRRAASSLQVCVAAARTSTRYSAVRRSLVQVRDSISLAAAAALAAGFKFAICQAERSSSGLMCAQKPYDALRPLRADRTGTSVIQGGLPVLRFSVCASTRRAGKRERTGSTPRPGLPGRGGPAGPFEGCADSLHTQRHLSLRSHGAWTPRGLASLSATGASPAGFKFNGGPGRPRLWGRTQAGPGKETRAARPRGLGRQFASARWQGSLMQARPD